MDQGGDEGDAFHDEVVVCGGDDHGDEVDDGVVLYIIDKYYHTHEIVRRSDSLSDINWGMTILANSIKVFSAILTILAVDDTDRYATLKSNI